MKTLTGEQVVVSKMFSLGWFLIMINFLWEANGYSIDSSIKSPGFNSLMDLHQHNSQLGVKTGSKPDLSIWRRRARNNVPAARDLLNRFSFNDDVSDRRRQQFEHLSSSQIELLKQVSLLKGKHGRHDFGVGGKVPTSPPSGADKPAILKEKPMTPSVQFWSKRDTNGKSVLKENQVAESETALQRVKKYAQMDAVLENLQPDSRCTEGIGLCAKLPLQTLDCLMHCQLKTQALAKPTIKFLFSLFKVYKSYPKMLCPTFGRIYNEIPSMFAKHTLGNSLKGFLTGVGVVDDSPVNVDFVKIAPSSLLNNLVKYGQGEDIELVKSIINTAETAASLELSERNLFPSIYGNPMCKLVPKEGWFVSMIDATTKYPTITDIFLRGFWILTRALSVNMPHSLNGMFASMVSSIKLLAGVDCSIIAYAEHGKPFKCRQPPPIDQIYEKYSKHDKKTEPENAFSWVVCGAHQIEIPEWIKAQEGLKSRSDYLREANATYEAGKLWDDLDQFPNPDEMYPLEKD